MEQGEILKQATAAQNSLKRRVLKIWPFIQDFGSCTFIFTIGLKRLYLFVYKIDDTNLNDINFFGGIVFIVTYLALKDVPTSNNPIQILPSHSSMERS